VVSGFPQREKPQTSSFSLDCWDLQEDYSFWGKDLMFTSILRVSGRFERWIEEAMKSGLQLLSLIARCKGIWGFILEIKINPSLKAEYHSKKAANSKGNNHCNKSHSYLIPKDSKNTV
jgi:hypothetical protein